MKKILNIFIISLFVLFFWKTSWFDINSLLPAKSYVVDQVWILDKNQKNQLEKQIQDLKDKYTAEILVIIIPSTDWADISALWTEIWQKVWVWKSDKDNWVVILIAINDRAWNISTWYWVEWVLPDLLTKRIWEKNFTLFKDQKYFDWIFWAINDFQKAFDWDPSIIPLQKEKSEEEFPPILIFIFFISVILSSIFLKPLFKNKEYKKAFKFILIAYLITLPIAYIAIWIFSILANIFIWIFWVVFWVFWNASGKWNRWGYRWWSSGWGFWGFSWGRFGWGWSSWKW